MAPDKRDELYNNLINSGRVTENEIGTIDDFKAAITDEATAKEFHQNLLNSGIFTISDIGDAADFWLSIRDDFAQQPTATTQPTAQQPTRNMGTPGYVPNRFGIPTQQPAPVAPTVNAQPTTTPQPQQSRRQYDYRTMQGSGSVQTPAAEQPAYRPQAAPKPQQPTYQQAQQQQPIYNTQAETPATPEFRNTQKMYSDAADKAWQKAEQDTKALREANTKKIEDIYNDNHSTMLGKMAMAQTRATALPIEGMAASLKAHDMEKMANDAWGYVSDEDKEYLLDGFMREIMREAARSGGSGGTMSQEEAKKALREEAERRAKARQYQAMYDKAVAANAPKDVLDFLQRKIVEGNSLSKLAIAAARTIAGTRGDMDARAVATHDYGKGHRVADITGSVLQIATDPVTWAAGGAGKGAVKGATAIAERAAGTAATRRLAATKGGQLAQRMIGGSANFAAFEGLGNIVEQLQQGGVYNEETGQYEYSLKDVAKAAGHGVLLGGATGVVGGLVGNVGDKVFDRVASTAGKLAVRGGQTLTSIAAEGTIFAAPELISGEGDFDTWLESVELMAGFKLQHGLKALPGTMGRLMRVPESRAGFETRLRDLLQGRPDLALTNDEREELERGGYTDLSELAEAYKGIEGKLVRMGDEMPYDRFSQLMADNSISEAARAKMYYYVTGRGMVQSTVTAAEIAEHRDHEGNITDYVVKSYNKDGGVITSRTYKSKKAAEVEFGRLTRQSELNSIDMLEKLYDRLPGTDATTAKMLRDVIGRESGIDIDKVIGKEENRRTDEEKAALQEYLNTMARECQDAWDRQHVDVNQQRLQPDWQEAYDMGYNSDEQQRSDISIEREDNPNDQQAQAAWQGVEDRIRQDAADRADQRRAEGERMAYKGNGDMQGMLRPLTIKEKSSEIDPQTGEKKNKVVYLVNGNIAIEPNGNGLSREGTDKTIYVYDPETGDTHELDPFAGAGVLEVGEPVSMEDYLANNEQQSQAEVQQEIDNATGKVNVQPNTPFVTPEGRQGIVKSVEGDNVIVQFADGEMEEASIPLADMQQYADELRRQEYEARHPQTPTEQPQQPNTGEVGQAPTAEQTAPQEGEQAAEDTRTPAQRTYDDVVAKLGADRASKKIDATAKVKADRLTKAQKALKTAQETADNTEYGSKEEQKAEEAVVKAQAEYDAAQQDMAAWDEVRKLRDQALLAQSEAEDAARKAELERKRAEETEAQRKQREAYEAEQARRKAEAEAAEKRRQEENERLRQQKAEAAANPQPAEEPAPIEGTKGQASQLAIARQELEGDPEALAMLDEFTPRTLVEVAATLLASGKNATKLLREDFKRETGYSDADVKRYPFLFAGADKGGITLARFGEMVEEAAREYGVQFNENDATAGIGAALELLGSVSSQADINGYITNSRIAEAYDYHNAALAAARVRMLEAYGMTEGEYEAYMSWLEDAAEQGKQTITDEEFNKIFNIYGQEQTTDVESSDQQGAETAERTESAETDVSQNGERGNGETDAGTEQAAVNKYEEAESAFFGFLEWTNWEYDTNYNWNSLMSFLKWANKKAKAKNQPLRKFVHEWIGDKYPPKDAAELTDKIFAALKEREEAKKATAQQPKEEAEGGTETAPQPVGGATAQGETPAAGQSETWEEHVNKAMEAYDKEYAAIEKSDGERLRKEAAGYSDERLLNTYIRNAGISQIFGKGREGMRKFVSEEKNYKAEKLDDVKENHLEAAPDAARQSFVQDVLRAELDRRGIEYKEEYTFAETSEANDWYKKNVEGKTEQPRTDVGETEGLIEEMAAVDERERSLAGKPGYKEAYDAKAALADRIAEIAGELPTKDLQRIHKEAKKRGMHSIMVHVESELLKRRDGKNQRVDGKAAKVSAKERRLRDAVVDLLRKAGIDVMTESEEGQRVLDAANGRERQHRVYHGSGADFEAFDHTHMGEGEGAQSFGWGTYVTEVKGIGRRYARAMGQPTYQGRKYNDIRDYWNGDEDTQFVILQLLRYLEREPSRTLQEAIDFTDKVYELRIARYNGQNEDIRRRTILNSLSKDDFNTSSTLYTVEIPEDNGSNYLDWDKAVTAEQQGVIYKHLRENNITLPSATMQFFNGKSKEWTSGNELYYFLTTQLGSPQKASEFLHSAGFVGIKYPADYYNGGRSDYAKNYVIFNEGDLQITDKVKFFRTENGDAYGFTMGGKIYLDPKIATAETPIHEYTHLWAEALRQANPKAWEQLKSELEKDKDLMAYVQRLYPELKGDELMDEVFAHFSGRRGAERLRAEQERMEGETQSIVGKAKVIAMFENLRNALKKFWNAARELFGGKVAEGKSKEEFADMVLGDLESGFNPSTDSDVRFRGEEEPVFYSNAMRAVENIKQERATPEQWVKMIEKQGGLKAGEDKWLGLSEWLKGSEAKTLTKGEVLDYIRANEIQIEEVEYGDYADDADFELLKQEYDQWLHDEGYDYAQERLIERFGDDATIAFTDVGGELEIADSEAAAALLGKEMPINSTRLEYTTEGLDNKREIVLTVPTIEPWNEHDEIHFGEAGGGRAVAWVRFGETTISRKPTKEEVEKRVASMPKANQWEKVDGSNFAARKDVYFAPGTRNQSGHDYIVDNKGKFVVEIGNSRKYFSLPFVRDGYDTLDEAVNAYNEWKAKQEKVNNKVLVIDEIQSKRHQEGREKGYTKYSYDDEVEARNAFNEERARLCKKYDIPLNPQNESIGKIGKLATEEEKNNLQSLYDKWGEIVEENNKDTIPDAPFEKNWHEVAMKRMLRFAAENGYDKVAWTTGEQQAERYDLSDKVDEIKVTGGVDNTFTVTGIKDGETIIQKDAEGEKGLADLIGKDMARKAYSNLKEGKEDFLNEDGAVSFTGENLAIGGEGMKGFYDQILPRFMDKYGKKWGVKTGEVELPNIGDNGLTMWSVDVTDDMRESVMRGQPLFRNLEESDNVVNNADAGTRPLTDREKIAKLESEPKVKVYRSMQLIDGKLYPPMSARVDGQLREPSEIGVWEEAEEHPELADENGKFKLDKGNKKSLKAAYNPYIHTSRTMLNDQFSEAQSRPNLVVVEVEIPESELNGTYRAEKAKDSIGAKQWKAGVIQGQLSGTREVILSRWAKPVRIVPDAEVAENIARQIDGQVSVMPSNVVTPQVRAELEKRGVRFVETDNTGRLTSGSRKGETWAQVYGKNATKQREGGEEAYAGEWYDRNSVERIGEFAGYTPKQIAKMNARQEQTARNKFRDAAEKLHLSDNITFADTIDNVPGLTDEQRREWRRKKGWYSPRTGKIVIILGNHKSMDDVMKSILHEGVEHHGLRQMFGEHFNTFLDNVYLNASPEIRGRINDMAKKHGWDFREATEEYLATLAEDTDFERPENQSWWKQVKDWFIDMLHKIGFKLHDAYDTITDNELRYILWRSYQNLVNPGRYNSVVEEAKDIAKQYELKVGQWDETWTIAAEEEPNATIEYGGRRIPIWATNGRRENRADRVERNDRMGSDYNVAADGVAEDGVRFRDGEDEESDSEERESIEQLANDRSIGTAARFAAVAARNAQESHDNAEALAAALNFTSQNLAEIVKATKAQKKFDKATVKQVTDMARVMVSAGYLDSMGRADVKGLLKAIRESTGETDNTDNVNRIIDIMVKNQLKNQENTLATLLKIKGSRVDARGINVQGKLDPNGQQTIQAFKNNMKEQRETIERRIADAEERMTSEDRAIADAAYNEKVGLQLALDYVEKIGQSKADEKDIEAKKRAELSKVYDYTRVVDVDEQGNALFKKDGTERTHEVRHVRAEYKGKISDEKKAERERVEQTAAAMDDAIRHMRMERIDAYTDFIAQVAGNMKESMERAKAFKEADRRRVEIIHHLANSDMQGRKLKGQDKDTALDNLSNNVAVRIALSPLMNLDQMLRMFGRQNVDGKGNLWNYYMRGWIDAVDGEQTWKERYMDKLNAKVKELFGKHGYNWLEHYANTKDGMTVQYWDGTKIKEVEMPQSRMLYIYAVEKMPMGKATNRRMGLTDEDIAIIEDRLDPKLKEFVDWVQSELLPEMGRECDQVHMRMFGAHMDSIENYFPFDRDTNAMPREEENGQERKNNKITVLTGAIKKRTPNVVVWDMKSCNIFDVLTRHIEEMSHWANFAELNRDFGTLESYNRFKQQVMAMDTVYGSGKNLWNNFMEVCAIATDAYDPQRGEFDKNASLVLKGVAMGKVALRPFTAIKQILSQPAFWGEANPIYMIEDLASLGLIPWYKGQKSNRENCFLWAWNNMPNFRKRIMSRTTGDFYLQDTEYNEQNWMSKIMDKTKWGMLPNIAVDAWTIAMGSHAVYRTNKDKYIRQGLGEREAERRAIQDAELCFNKSQQSSEGAFMAPMQIDHTVAAGTAMIFRNASTSYTREWLASGRQLKRLVSGEVNAEAMAKQILRARNSAYLDGEISSEELQKVMPLAKRELRTGIVRQSVNHIMFGWVLPWFWRIGGLLPLFLLSGDDDEKKKRWEEAKKQSLFGPVEGFLYGDVQSDVINKLVGFTDKDWKYIGRQNPTLEDAARIKEKLGYDPTAAITDALGLLVGMCTGINPQTIVDWATAIVDKTSGDRALAREGALFAARLLNCPPSQLDQIYFDEIEMTGTEASNYTIDELVDRWAEYKTRNSHMGLMPEEALEKTKKRGYKIIEEKAGKMSDEALAEMYDRSGITGKARVGKVAAGRLSEEYGMDLKDSFGSGNALNSKYGKIYAQHRTYIDMAEDITLNAEIKRLTSEKERLESIGAYGKLYNETINKLEDLEDVKNKDIPSYKSNMVNELGNPMSEEAINTQMENIRKARRRVLYPEQAANPTDNVEE